MSDDRVPHEFWRPAGYEVDRLRITFRVYMLAAVFVLLSFFQWLLVMLINDIDFNGALHYVALPCLFLALLAVSILVVWEPLRYIFPLNCILIVILLESLTWGLMRSTIEVKLLYFLGSTVIVIMVFALVISIGVLLPFDLTLHSEVVFACTVLLFLGATVFLILAVLTDLRFSILIYAGFLAVIAAMFIMHHAQAVAGGRFAEIRERDIILAAIIIYSDFVILFVLTLLMTKGLFGVQCLRYYVAMPSIYWNPASLRNRVRIRQYRRSRFLFTAKVYLTTLIFIGVTFGIWSPVIFDLYIPSYIKGLLCENYPMAMQFLLGALILETLIVIWYRLRFMFPINWILCLVIVGCLACGMTWIVVGSSLDLVLLCMIISAGIVLFAIFISMVLSFDFTMQLLIVFALATVFFAGSVLFLLFSLMIGSPGALYIYIGFIGAIVFLFVMYHAQTVHGGRFAEMRPSDSLLAALLIYHDYIITLVLVYMVLTSYGVAQTHSNHIFGYTKKCASCDRAHTIITIA